MRRWLTSRGQRSTPSLSARVAGVCLTGIGAHAIAKVASTDPELGLAAGVMNSPGSIRRRKERLSGRWPSDMRATRQPSARRIRARRGPCDGSGSGTDGTG